MGWKMIDGMASPALASLEEIILLLVSIYRERGQVRQPWATLVPQALRCFTLVLWEQAALSQSQFPLLHSVVSY